MKTNPIFILSGPLASGKSTIAPVLLKQFSFGIHIPVDILRSWVVSGKSDPIGSWDDETDRQFRLARQGAVQLAVAYAEAGFAVVIDDVITPEHFQAHYSPYLGGKQAHPIMLLPDVDIALSRNAQRGTNQLNDLIFVWHRHVSQFDLAALGWHVIDNSDLSVDETVGEILGRFDEI